MKFLMLWLISGLFFSLIIFVLMVSYLHRSGSTKIDAGRLREMREQTVKR